MTRTRQFFRLPTLLIVISIIAACGQRDVSEPIQSVRLDSDTGTQVDTDSARDDCVADDSTVLFPSPDGGHVASITPFDDALIDSYILCIMGTDDARISYVLSVSAPISRNNVLWAPDGDKLAVSAFGGGASAPQSIIYVVNAATHSVDYILPGEGKNCFGSGERLARAPNWSPDGSILAFVGRATHADGCGEQVYITHDGVDEVALGNDSHLRIDTLQWSADGQQITFTATDTATDSQRRQAEYTVNVSH